MSFFITLCTKSHNHKQQKGVSLVYKANANLTLSSALRALVLNAITIFATNAI